MLDSLALMLSTRRRAATEPARGEFDVPIPPSCLALTLLICSFVEFETAADLRTAVEKLDNREFKGQRVTCVANVRSMCCLFPPHD